MIEINLLPEGIRKTEGTPPRRFALYIGFLMMLLTVGFYIGKYRQVEIPNMTQKIALAKVEKDNLKKKQDEIDKVTADIESLNKKIADLDDLNFARIRFARLFDRMTDAMPEGVWFRSFSVAPDGTVSGRYAPAGRRYALTMNSNAIGANQQERDHKVTDLISNIEKRFNIPPESAPVPTPIPEDYGFCKFVGARFERPRLSSINPTSLAPMSGLDPKLIAQINAPKEGVDFLIVMSFDMPSPKNKDQ